MSFSYILKSKSLIVAVFVLSGCGGQIERDDAGGPVVPPPPAIDKVEDQAIEVEAPDSQQAEQEMSMQVGLPEMANRTEPAKIGLILGPGAVRTYAHLGVLQSLVKARLPIKAVVGLGWSAPIAAMYAANARLYDAEWKMMKLSAEMLPKAGILDRSIQPKPISSFLGEFLEKNLPKKKLSEYEISFACPSQSVFDPNVKMRDRGEGRDVVKRCMSVLPYFTAESGEFGSLTAVRESANWLRTQGADVIILVNVLEYGNLVDKDKQDVEYRNLVLWSEVRQAIKTQQLGITEVIGVNTSEIDVFSFNKRRDLILKGSETGRSAGERLSAKYGL